MTELTLYGPEPDRVEPEMVPGPGLPGLVVAYLGEIAAAEGEGDEARYWFEQALHSVDETARSLAATRLAALDTP